MSRGSSHGNFHFYPNDVSKFEKRGSFRIDLQGLSTLYKRIQDKHLGHDSGSFIRRFVMAQQEWEEVNRSLQAVIDSKLQKLDDELPELDDELPELEL